MAELCHLAWRPDRVAQGLQRLLRAWLASCSVRLRRCTAPTDIHPINGAKVMVVGPTEHPLALASLLTMALPFAIVPLLNATTPTRASEDTAVAIALIVAATLSTQEKTAMLAPLTVIIVLAIFRPADAPLASARHLGADPDDSLRGARCSQRLQVPHPGRQQLLRRSNADYSAIKPDISVIC